MSNINYKVVFGEHVLLAYPPCDRGTEVNEADEADDSKWDKYRVDPHGDRDSPE